MIKDKAIIVILAIFQIRKSMQRPHINIKCHFSAVGCSANSLGKSFKQ